MALKTTLEQLEEVQAAISTIVSGTQAADVDGRSYTRADLRVLQEREKYLLKRYRAEQRGGPTINSGYVRRNY